jgi:hypothetical protein
VVVVTGANAAASQGKFARTRFAGSQEALRNGRGGCGALLYERLVRRLPTRFPLFYLERGSIDHLMRDTEKSRACAIAPDLLEQNILVNERYLAQTKDDVGWRENNMTQITSIKLGLIAICFATVPLSLAQTPRTGTSRSNQTGAAVGATAGHSGLIGNSTSAAQLGTNFRSNTITAPNPNVGGHIGINAGAQTGISNQNGGITGGAAAGVGSSSGNSTGTTQIGTSARTGTNTTSTNTGAHTAAAAAAPARVTTIQPQFIPVPIRSPLPNNSPIGSNFSTAGESPSPLPSATVTPTPTPAQLL